MNCSTQSKENQPENESFSGLTIRNHHILDAPSKEKAANTLFGWEQTVLTAPDWIRELENGYTIQPSAFSPRPDGEYRHAKEYWNSTHFVCADADNIKGIETLTDGSEKNPDGLEAWTDQDGLSKRFPTLANKVYAVGESVSSMSDAKPPPHRRYRLIFLFDSPITSIDHYHQVLLALAKEFPIIPPVERSPTQPVFGNARDGFGFHICSNVLSLNDYPFEVDKGTPQPHLPFDETLSEFLRRHNIAYEESKEAGKYFVECPYKAHHTGGKHGKTDAYLLDDSNGYKWAFYCSHASCANRRTWEAFREGHGIPKTPAPPPREIRPPEKENDAPPREPPDKNNVEERIRKRVRNQWEARRTPAQIHDEVHKMKGASAFTTAELNALIDAELPRVQMESAFEIFNKNYPPLKYAVPGLITEGLTIIAGPAKLGKSFLCLNMALAITSGGIVANTIQIEDPQPVAYCALEDSERRIKDRLHMLQPDGNISPDLKITPIGKLPIPLDSAGIGILDRDMTEAGVKVVFIDTWQKVSPDPDKNKNAYEADYAVLGPLQEWASNKHIAVVLIHHLNKSRDANNIYNRISGSTGIQAAVDTMILMSKVEGKCQIDVTGRDIEEQNLAATFDFPHWTIEGEARMHVGTDARLSILNLLKDGEPWAAKDISDELGFNYTTVRQRLQRLVQSGDLERAGRGVYRLIMS